jgi:hypothetical protein
VVSHNKGLKKKIDLLGKDEAGVRTDEDGRLFDPANMTILNRYNVNFATNKPDGTPNAPVNARLLVVQWNAPTAPFSGTDSILFAIGYEVADFPAGTTKVFSLSADATNATTVTDGYRMVHFDLDYAVRIFPKK